MMSRSKLSTHTAVLFNSSDTRRESLIIIYDKADPDYKLWGGFREGGNVRWHIHSMFTVKELPLNWVFV